MKTRSFSNWSYKSGTWDALNVELIDFNGDYPLIKAEYEKIEFHNIVVCNDYKNIKNNSLVSFFVDDYILERYWNKPLKYVEMYRNAKYVMSPDFSLLIGMPMPMQMWNVYRNRLVAHIWQKNGVRIIPTISWSDKSSFDHCFNGIFCKSVVAISNVGCKNDEQKKYFDEGLNELIKRINPEKIIFQCNKKHKEEYESDLFVFIDSYWESKRKQYKLN